MNIKIVWFDGKEEIKEDMNEKQLKVIERALKNGDILLYEIIEQ